MNITNRLVNPTPFDVEWPYHRGIVLKIPAYGHYDLETSDMIEDFRPDSAGSESVSLLMRDYGIFLRDPSVPYEVQAVKAIRDCMKSKSEMCREARAGMEADMARTGNYDKSAVDKTFERLGFKRIEDQVALLERKLEFYERQIKGNSRILHKQFDPERTLLFLNPPREFETKIAMLSYLEDHPEDKVKYDKWIAANYSKEKEAASNE